MSLDLKKLVSMNPEDLMKHRAFLDEIQNSISIALNIQTARKEGKIVEKLKDIPEPEGHKHEFNEIRMSPDSSYYKCECGVVAYSCPNCGIAQGNPTESTSYEQAAVEGKKCGCTYCGRELGLIS